MTSRIARDGDAFFLTRNNDLRIQLSDEEVLAIAQSAASFRQDILARLHPGAVFATPVSQTDANWDALGENILVELQFGQSGNLITEMTPERSELLANQLRDRLAERPASQSRH